MWWILRQMMCGRKSDEEKLGKKINTAMKKYYYYLEQVKKIDQLDIKCIK